MRMPILALACVLAAWSSASLAQASAPLTLAEAMRLAETAHPMVRAREAQRSAAEGVRREAEAPLFNNPELNLEQARRRLAPDGRANEWTVGIAQPFEIAGQQSARRTAATRAQEALDAEIDDARRHARAEAATRFHAVLVAQRRVQLEQRALELAEATAQAVARRRSAGEDTRLDGNVAQIEAERVRNTLAAAREHMSDARSELGTALQLPPSTLPDVAGELAAASDSAPYSLDHLLSSALAQSRLRALTAREEAARARAGVESGARYPDLRLGVSVGREGVSEAREQVTTLSLSVPLPLFKRNDAAIGQALSEATQAEIERTTAARDVQAQVRRLWGRLNSQRDRVRRLQSTVMAASSDNQRLAARSREVGQIGLLDQVQVNRQAIDAERELTDALSEFHTTRIELELAAGWPQEGATR